MNPTVPIWGGPTGLDTTGTKRGDAVYSYGNSQLGLGTGAISAKQGSSDGDQGNGWSHLVSTSPPGVPAHSGSGFLDGQGRAIGILSTLDVASTWGPTGSATSPWSSPTCGPTRPSMCRWRWGTEPFSTSGR